MDPDWGPRAQFQPHRAAELTTSLRRASSYRSAPRSLATRIAKRGQKGQATRYSAAHSSFAASSRLRWLALGPLRNPFAREIGCGAHAVRRHCTFAFVPRCSNLRHKNASPQRRDTAFTSPTSKQLSETTPHGRSWAPSHRARAPRAPTSAPAPCPPRQLPPAFGTLQLDPYGAPVRATSATARTR